MSQRDWDNAHLINAALDIHGDEPAFGYRFIADEIEAEAGISASERRSAPSAASASNSPPAASTTRAEA